MICEAQYGSRTIQFRLERRKVKSLAIRVHPAGLVEVVAPLKADADEIGRRVARKGRWVLKQQRQFAEILGLPTGRKHRSGDQSWIEQNASLFSATSPTPWHPPD